MSRQMVDYALKYAAHGMAVFPVKEREKEPLTENGCKDASLKEADIRRWWSKFPRANIGIATGSPSGGLVVVDVDIDEESGVYGNESLRLWESEFSALPDTLTALTGRGGTHYYFHSDKEQRNRAHVLPGVDVRGDGGYVLAPPSLHPNGRHYQWEASSTAAPAPLPEDLFTLISGTGRNSGEGKASFSMPDQVEAGRRNDTLFRLSASLQAKGISDEAIYQAVLAENKVKCSPPLDEREVMKLVESALHYDKGEPQEEKSAEDIVQAVSGEMELLQEETFSEIFKIKDVVERQNAINKLRKKARELHIAKDFGDMLQAFQRKLIQKKKGDGTNLIQFTDAPLSGLRCGSWICDDLGVRRFKPNQKDVDGGFWEQACTHPILPTALLSNVDTGTEKLQIAFFKNGRWRSTTADRSLTASSTSIVKLADRGIQVITKEAGLLAEYLRDVESLNPEALPSYRSISRFGWVEGDFSPYAEGLRYDGGDNLDAVDHFYGSVRSEGNEASWLDGMKVVRQSSVQARMALAASMASPMISLLKKQCFMVHLWGTSETGKSVAQIAAASFWGNPEVGRYIRSLNNTRNCSDALAAFCSATPLILDELQSIKEDQSKRGGNFDAWIYTLCSGQGRGRLNQDGSMKSVGTWSLCAITSGEQPMTSSSSGGGAMNRILEVECSAPLFCDAPTIANLLKENFGWGGERWIKLLFDKKVLQDASESYNNAYSKLTDMGMADKQSYAASLCIAADFIAERYFFKDGVCLTVEEVAPYVLSKSEIDLAERTFQWISSWIAANPMRFTPSTVLGEVWGEPFEEEGGGYWILSSVLRKALENEGLSFKSCMTALDKKGYISKKRGNRAVTHRILGVPARCVKLFLNVGEQEFAEDEFMNAI